MCFTRVKDIQDQVNIYSVLCTGKKFINRGNTLRGSCFLSVRMFITYSSSLSSSLVILNEIKFKVLQSRNTHKSPTCKFYGCIIRTCHRSLPIRRLFTELQGICKAMHFKHPNNVDKVQGKMLP